jgi:predicted phage-related endonuclease
MGTKAINNRIEKIMALEEQKKAIDQQIEELKDQIKSDMTDKDVDEIETGSFTVRWKEVISHKLDGKALKAALPEIYNQFCKASASRRFTIA